MSEHAKTLPALLAVLIGITIALITYSPVGLVLFLLLAFAAYHQRNDALNQLSKILYLAGAAISGALAFKAVIIGVAPVVLLCGLICTFCTSVIYTRMKI